MGFHHFSKMDYSKDCSYRDLTPLGSPVTPRRNLNWTGKCIQIGNSWKARASDSAEGQIAQDWFCK